MAGADEVCRCESLPNERVGDPTDAWSHEGQCHSQVPVFFFLRRHVDAIIAAMLGDRDGDRWDQVGVAGNFGASGCFVMPRFIRRSWIAVAEPPAYCRTDRCGRRFMQPMMGSGGVSAPD
jgi:hypothetical protein